MGYENRIVAFLDILGFKNLVNTEDFDNVMEIFKSLRDKGNIVRLLEDDMKNPLKLRYNNIIFSDLEIHIISDSVFISVPNKYPESLSVVIGISNLFQQRLFECKSFPFLRGAIKAGELYHEGGLIFGKAVIDAYLSEERNAIFPRIIIDESLLLGKEEGFLNQNLIHRDSDNYYVIDAVKNYIIQDGLDSWDEIKESEHYNKIRKIVDDRLKTIMDDDARKKYIWLDMELKRIEEEIKGNSEELNDYWVEFLKRNEIDLKTFYYIHFGDLNKVEDFLNRVYQFDCNERIPRQMINQVHRFVILAKKIDNIYPPRDGLRLFFIGTCMESLRNLGGEAEGNEFEESFSKCFSLEAEEYIRDGLKLKKRVGRYNIFDENYDSAKVLEFLKLIALIRSQVVNKGIFWKPQVFSTKEDVWTSSGLTVDNQNLIGKGDLATEKTDVISYDISTILQFEKFCYYFTEACIEYVEKYMQRIRG